MPGLSRSARRRLLKASEPGAVVVMGQAEKFGLRGPGRGLEGPKQRVRTGNLIDIGMRTDVLAWDLDCRELVRRLQVDLAEMYSRAILSGRQADGRPMPAQDEATMQIKAAEDAPGDTLGVRTGLMARRFGWSRVSGGPMAARGGVFPFTGSGPGEDKNAAFARKAWARRATDDGIALVSATGAADAKIQETLRQWTADAKTDPRGYVGTPARTRTSKGDLQRP